MRNNEKGITLIALAVTIIVLIIITTISVVTGTKSQDLTKEKKDEIEVKMVQNAILQRKTKNDISGKNDYPGVQLVSGNQTDENLFNKVNQELQEKAGTTLKGSIGDYKKLTNESGSLEALGITNTEDSFLVNYNTGEVVDITKISEEDPEMFYVYAVNNT